MVVRVFAVHNWETGDGYHHVRWKPKASSKQWKIKRFRKWTKAEAFASKKAQELGVSSFTVDTPKRPHKAIKVKKKARRKKK